MKILNLKSLLSGQSVRFSDGSSYIKDSNGSLIRHPPKPPSRRDRRRQEATLNRQSLKP